MDVEALLSALFNVFLVVFIVSSMLSAGFTTTVDTLVSVLKRYWLIIAVLVGAFVLRPLAGWLTAEVFSLDESAFIAMLIIAAVPGAPLGVKYIVAARADVSLGATLQVLLAVIGSFTFAPTANLLFELADIGGGLELPVWDILRAVVVLQVIPFAIGMIARHFNETSALDWNKTAVKISGPAFLAFFALALLGSWQLILDLIGSSAILAGIVFAVAALIIGFVLSVGDRRTRETSGLIEITTNAGPAFTAIAIAFNNEATIVGAAVTYIIIQIALGIVLGSYFGKGNGDESVTPEADTSGGVDQTSVETQAAPE